MEKRTELDKFLRMCSAQNGAVEKIFGKNLSEITSLKIFLETGGEKWLYLVMLWIKVVNFQWN